MRNKRSSLDSEAKTTSGVESVDNDELSELEPQPRRVFFAWTCKAFFKNDPTEIISRIKHVAINSSVIAF